MAAAQNTSAGGPNVCGVQAAATRIKRSLGGQLPWMLKYDPLLPATPGVAGMVP